MLRKNIKAKEITIIKKSIQFLILFFCIYPHIVQAGFGISPSTIEVKDLLRSSKYENEFVLQRNEVNTAQKLLIEITSNTGDERYVQLPTKDLIWPKGERTLSVPFRIVPENAANGEHKITFIFTTQPLEELKDSGKKKTEDNTIKAGAAISLGTQGTLVFKVTDQEVRNLAVYGARIYDTEPEKKLILRTEVENLGNVDSSIDKAEIIITSHEDLSFVFSTTIEDFELIPALSQKTIYSELTHSLKTGTYYAAVKYWFNNKLIYEAEELVFRVYPPGTLDQEGEMINFEINATDFVIGDLIKFDGTFKNTGPINSEVIFITEIYLDDRLVDLMRVEKPTLLRPGEAVTLSLTKRPTEAGKYKAKGYFTYGISKTKDKELNFTVNNQVKSYLLIAIIILSCLFAAILWLYYFIRRRKKKNKKYQKARAIDSKIRKIN